MQGLIVEWGNGGSALMGYLHSVDWSAGLECWNGVLEWNHWNGVKHWNGPVTTFGKVLGIFL